jgi:hypothetical protein
MGVISTSRDSKTGSMFEKLTLTGNLSDEMKELKSKFSEIMEALQQAQFESEMNKKKYKEFRLKYGLLHKEINSNRSQMDIN